MNDRTRVAALLTATENHYFRLIKDGINQEQENFWLGKLAGIRACLTFMSVEEKQGV